MKEINNEEVLNLLQTHKVSDVNVYKIFHSRYKTIWEIDGMLLDNGQLIALDGNSNSINYLLIESQDIKEQ